MKTLQECSLGEKRTIVRVDFNVPMDEQLSITDDIRIRAALPTIRFLLEKRAKIILCSHLGRPGGKRVEKLSLAPVAKELESILEHPVALAPDCVGRETEALINSMLPGDIVLLENLRFHRGETENESGFTEKLARVAEAYINDAFAVSHRAHASVTGVPALVGENGAGLLLQKEMEYFHRSVENPARPLAALIGGAKVSSKIGVLENMLDRVDRMLIGGAMANTFLKSMDIGVGSSRVEEELFETAKRFLKTAEDRGVRVHLPLDLVVADAFSADAAVRNAGVWEVPEDWMALDIGYATIAYFQEALADARTIVWNGPMGVFEMDAFSRGTTAMCRALASSRALSVVGGGDSNAALKKSGEAENISYMSTGGGAFLRLMEGKTLPGVDALG